MKFERALTGQMRCGYLFLRHMSQGSTRCHLIANKPVSLFGRRLARFEQGSPASKSRTRYGRRCAAQPLWTEDRRRLLDRNDRAIPTSNSIGGKRRARCAFAASAHQARSSANFGNASSRAFPAAPDGAPSQSRVCEDLTHR